MSAQFLLNLVFINFFIYLYYHLVKKSMIILAGKLVKEGVFRVKIAVGELTGVTELIFIVCTHLLFAYFLAIFLGIVPDQLFHLSDFHPKNLLFGLLLGIGQMGLSSTICFVIIQLLQTFFKSKVPTQKEEWHALVKSGWLRHHLHTLKLLPLPLAAMIIGMQIFAEETVFRGIICTYCLPASPYFAGFFSTALFVWVQSFFMPNKIAKMFPIVGALVVGVVNSFLFIETENLIPLIIAHLTFFFLAVL